MGKTFEALLRAEKERQVKLGEDTGERIPGVTPEPCPLPAQISEEYRRLKNRILHIDSRQKIRTMLFVSPTSGEGNSMVVSHFAIVLACEGDRVLLVDTNLRHPSIHEIFNLELDNGFTDLILQKLPLEEVLKGTPFRNLQVITGGSAQSDLFPAIHSRFLDSCIARLKLKTDWVLFDSSSMDMYNDAITLAPRLDGVVLVIQAEKTRWEVVERVKNSILDGGGKILGTVLNRRRYYIPRRLYKTL